jgi:hypothetical protein
MGVVRQICKGRVPVMIAYGIATCMVGRLTRTKDLRDPRNDAQSDFVALQPWNITMVSSTGMGTAMIRAFVRMEICFRHRTGTQTFRHRILYLIKSMGILSFRPINCNWHSLLVSLTVEVWADMVLNWMSRGMLLVSKCTSDRDNMHNNNCYYSSSKVN